MIKLLTSKGYDCLSPERKKAICNGAGAAGDWRSEFIPNTVYGLDCIEAFNIHDYDYNVGLTITDKMIADVTLLVNMILIITIKGGWLQTPRIYRAATYFVAVHLNGNDAFFLPKKGNLNLKPK